MAGPQKEKVGFLEALQRRRFSVGKGLLTMALGWMSFVLGLIFLGSVTPDDPRWFVMLVIVLTWMSVFVVIAGCAFVMSALLQTRFQRSHTIWKMLNPRVGPHEHGGTPPEP